MELSDHRRIYKQVVYNYFRKCGAWPTYKQVETELLPKYFNNDDTLEDDEYFDFGEPVELSIAEIYECKGSEKDLADFLRVLQYCVSRVIQSNMSGTAVKSKDVRRDLGMDDIAVRKAGLLIGDSRIYEPTVSYIEDTDWEIGPCNDIIHFEGVSSIEDYLARRLTYGPNNIKAVRTKETSIVNPSSFIEKIAQTDPADIQATTAALMQIDNSYYLNALRQSKLSFGWAIGLGVTGVAFFVASVIITLILYRQSTDASYVGPIITACSGGVVEVLAGIILVIHSRASDQLNLCHIRLNRLQRFLVSIGRCEYLEGDLKQTTRVELIKKLND